MTRAEFGETEFAVAKTWPLAYVRPDQVLPVTPLGDVDNGVASMPSDSSFADRVLFGAAYYAEYRPGRDINIDLDLMKEAGFSVIRVGESVWSTWEPREGVFETEWLRPVLDGAHARGISVILGTPTYAIPPWLQKKHPELAGQTATGRPEPWGRRQEVDYSSEIFTPYVERIVRTVVGTYASHPAVIGFQVDNEPGMILFHNDGAFSEFVVRLERQYGSIDALNEAWGLTYWSHRLNSFDELWRPDGNSFPQYDLAWRTFQASLTTEFIARQVAIVREYASAEQFITTCIAYPRPAQDDAQLVKELDVVAGNPYYDMQYGLDLVFPPDVPDDFAVSGVGVFFRQADRMWSGRGEPFLVTETNAQSIGDHAYNRPPFPGQTKQAAYGFVSRGARMVEYWHWQTLNHGAETYWGGILPHSGVPGRVYGEIAELGQSLSKVGPSLTGYIPDHDITMVYSNASRWALEYSGLLRTDGGARDIDSYTTVFDSFHTGVIESNRQANIVHDINLTEMDPAEFAVSNPVLIVPALYVASEEIIQWLSAYANVGGHLVLGIRSLYADTEARARQDVAPPGFAAAAGVWYEEFSNISEDIELVAIGDIALSPGAAATRWVDGLISTDAQIVADYSQSEIGRYPAITSSNFGRGRITYIGTVPNQSLAKDIAEWLAPRPHCEGWAATPAGRSTVVSGTSNSGRIRFIFNWSGEHILLNVPVDCTDLESGDAITAGDTLSLTPRTTRILLEN